MEEVEEFLLTIHEEKKSIFIPFKNKYGLRYFTMELFDCVMNDGDKIKVTWYTNKNEISYTGNFGEIRTHNKVNLCILNPFREEMMSYKSACKNNTILLQTYCLNINHADSGYLRIEKCDGVEFVFVSQDDKLKEDAKGVIKVKMAWILS